VNDEDDDYGSNKNAKQHTQKKEGYGYSYAATKMKARSLRKFPKVRGAFAAYGTSLRCGRLEHRT